jgi:hypothetical protein
MDAALRKQIKLHSAGTTVRHAGPYADLEVPVSMVAPSNDFIQKWVAPFYMWGIRKPHAFNANYAPIRPEITPEIVSSLLIWFNWRSRIVGAYFAAIEQWTDFSDHIGRLLLRSDVCYAGDGYALALAVFNNEQSIQYLRKYLDYYLGNNDLWFDQGSVMGAVAHLDRINETNILNSYIPKWENFVTNKPNHDLAQSIGAFEAQMNTLKLIGSHGT